MRASAQKLQGPSAINVRQDESRKCEEKLDPKVTVPDQEIERLEVAIVMAFAIVLKHEHERRYGARAGECADLTGTRSRRHAHALEISGNSLMIALIAD
jgi:hypothetical protein